MRGYKLFYFVTCYYLGSLIVVPKNTYGQKTTLRFDKWTSAELSSAATYKGLEYLNPIDTAVLFYCNLFENILLPINICSTIKIRFIYLPLS